MPFILIGMAVLAGAGVVALLLRDGDSPSVAEPGSSEKFTGDSLASPTVAAQTTSESSSPANDTAAPDARAEEPPDRYADSPAATTRPVGVRVPENVFIDMAPAPGPDEATGYAVDDMAQEVPELPFMDDIVRPRDLANAPNSGALGSLLPELK